jgi:hypothetical protein
MGRVQIERDNPTPRVVVGDRETVGRITNQLDSERHPRFAAGQLGEIIDGRARPGDGWFRHRAYRGASERYRAG